VANLDSEDDFLRMQQEAIRRVREMQSRARATLENAGMHIEGGEPSDPLPREPAPQQDAPAPQPRAPQNADAAHKSDSSDDSSRRSAEQNRRPQQRETPQRETPEREAPQREAPRRETAPPHREGAPAVHMPGLNIDIESDQLLLMLSLYLLVQDGADKWLILALAYVLF
jgi:hypothetical protein